MALILLISTSCRSTARQVGADMILPSMQAPHTRSIDTETGAPVSSVRNPKEDRLLLANGDKITCEIKTMDHGLLTVKTDSMGTLSVEWVDVVGLNSRFNFRVETKDKQTYYGSLAASTESGMLVIDQDGFQVVLDMLDVVLIEKFETGFFDRITGYINFGFNFSEATTIKQLNFSGGLKYKSKINVLSLDASTITTNQEAGSETNRVDLTLDFKRFFTGGLYGYANTGAQHNSEMGIALRTSVGLGAGVAPIRSSVMDLTVSAGLGGNNEVALGDGGDQTSLEGVLSASYQVFVFKSPKTDLATNLTYFPSITETGRYRLSYEFRVRQEFVKDLFLDLKFYLSYDSDPPGNAVSNRDYGIITGIGYSW